MLKRLTVRDFRCFDTADIELAPDINWIIGENASGKTSLLEAIFFLGHGRSFRTHRPDRLMREGTDRFQAVARIGSEHGEKVLGMARGKQGSEGRLGGEPLKSLADAARALPVVVLDSEMNRLISEGPGERRRWLDWGVFHVEPRYLDSWRSFRRALKQRNEGLRQGLPDSALRPWTEALVESGLKLDEYRRAHMVSLAELASEYAKTALRDGEVTLRYAQGWAEDDGYSESLARHLDKDRELGMTRYGPHRADVKVLVDGVPAIERVSRGQLKMLAGALWLAQAKLYSETAAARLLLLVDDLAAELDEDHLRRFVRLLQAQDAQLVLTAIQQEDQVRTGLQGGRMFHVEHGQITLDPA